ncbi:MAG: hypothetical protein L0H53_00560 [Candidatus Nitrosocosmicus sp.]|nr:hypothetical protein [Candidatus Nitrosocosmicus sp.]MDN5866028.1 hypothetical protein [Candidatus Nitrosocosmicus sp.]
MSHPENTFKQIIERQENAITKLEEKIAVLTDVIIDISERMYYQDERARRIVTTRLRKKLENLK